MRDNLAPYIKKFVLCKGWIEDWKEMDNEITRVYIKHPVIKEPNKDVLFDDLKVISKEHHINLFVKNEQIGESLKRLEEIYFNGIVSQYRRSNGTIDYGITPLPLFSALHTEIDFVYEDMEGRLSPKASDFITQRNLIEFEFKYLHKLIKLDEKLENAGDRLPTFSHTYGEYKQMINEVIEDISYGIKFIRGVCSSRKLRRAYGVPFNFAQHIPTYQQFMDSRKM